MSGLFKSIYYLAGAIAAGLAAIYTVFSNPTEFEQVWDRFTGNSEQVLACLPHWLDQTECIVGSPLELSADLGTVYPGDALPLNFHSNAHGYISIWNIDTEGRVTRFFPDADEPMAVVAGREYRSGRLPVPVFEVSGGPGVEQAVLVFSAASEAHGASATYPNRLAFETMLRQHPQWRSSEMEYRLLSRPAITPTGH